MMVNFDIKSNFPFYKICSNLDPDSTIVFHSATKNIYINTMQMQNKPHHSKCFIYQTFIMKKLKTGLKYVR